MVHRSPVISQAQPHTRPQPHFDSYHHTQGQYHSKYPPPWGVISQLALGLEASPAGRIPGLHPDGPGRNVAVQARRYCT